MNIPPGRDSFLYIGAGFNVILPHRGSPSLFALRVTCGQHRSTTNLARSRLKAAAFYPIKPHHLTNDSIHDQTEVNRIIRSDR